MTKNKTAVFRYDEDVQTSLDTILEYIRQAAPGTDPNISDAIRFALITKAGDIRMEQRQTPA